jgi:hypothetical protein
MLLRLEEDLGGAGGDLPDMALGLQPWGVPRTAAGGGGHEEGGVPYTDAALLAAGWGGAGGAAAGRGAAENHHTTAAPISPAGTCFHSTRSRCLSTHTHTHTLTRTQMSAQYPPNILSHSKHAFPLQAYRLSGLTLKVWDEAALKREVPLLVVHDVLKHSQVGGNYPPRSKFLRKTKHERSLINLVP